MKKPDGFGRYGRGGNFYYKSTLRVFLLFNHFHLLCVHLFILSFTCLYHEVYTFFYLKFIHLFIRILAHSIIHQSIHLYTYLYSFIYLFHFISYISVYHTRGSTNTREKQLVIVVHKFYFHYTVCRRLSC